jgi:tetratricopeptide (TPR) repeat protein
MADGRGAEVQTETVELQAKAVELLRQGRSDAASLLLRDALERGESAELWNDWGAVELSRVEEAFRRALALDPGHVEAATNLGIVLFSLGNKEEAASLLRRALHSTTGPARVHIAALLELCARRGGGAAPNALGCNAGQAPLVHRGQRVGYWRNEEFFPTSRCASCGYMSFAAPTPEFLAEYYQKEYPKLAEAWYTSEYDYDEERCAARARDILNSAERYIERGRAVIHESGCSFGGVVAKLRSMGYEATGTDLNANAIAEGQKRGNTWIYAAEEADFLRRANAPLDVLALYYSLEHMISPVDFLCGIRFSVERGGIVICLVANAVNYFSLAKSFAENTWFGYPFHLHYFSPASLLCLGRAAGYALLDVETRLIASNLPDAEALLRCKPESYSWRLADRLLQQAFMGQELRFVLTPTGSSVAARFAEQIRATEAICEAARRGEMSTLEACAR